VRKKLVGRRAEGAAGGDAVEAATQGVETNSWYGMIGREGLAVDAVV
jgi:hypothetical protein